MLHGSTMSSNCDFTHLSPLEICWSNAKSIIVIIHRNLICRWWIDFNITIHRILCHRMLQHILDFVKIPSQHLSSLVYRVSQFLSSPVFFFSPKWGKNFPQIFRIGNFSPDGGNFFDGIKVGKNYFLGTVIETFTDNFTNSDSIHNCSAIIH